MATLFCFGSRLFAEHFIAEFRRQIRPHRRHRAPRRARRALNAIRPGRLQALVFDGSRMPRPRYHAEADKRPRLMSIPPDESGDPVLAASAAMHSAAGRGCVRSSISRRSASTATTTAPGSTSNRRPQPVSERSRRTARRRARLAGTSAHAKAYRRRDPAPRRHLRAGTKRARRSSRAAKPAALSSLARCSTASTSPTSPRRSTPPLRAAPMACSTSPTTNRRRRPIRSSLPPSSWAVEPPPEIPFDEAAPTMSPMALSFWQECRRVRNDKLKRELGVTLRYPSYREGLTALLEEK